MLEHLGHLLVPQLIVRHVVDLFLWRLLGRASECRLCHPLLPTLDQPCAPILNEVNHLLFAVTVKLGLFVVKSFMVDFHLVRHLRETGDEFTILKFLRRRNTLRFLLLAFQEFLLHLRQHKGIEDLLQSRVTLFPSDGFLLALKLYTFHFTLGPVTLN